MAKNLVEVTIYHDDVDSVELTIGHYSFSKTITYIRKRLRLNSIEPKIKTTIDDVDNIRSVA